MIRTTNSLWWSSRCLKHCLTALPEAVRGELKRVPPSATDAPHGTINRSEIFNRQSSRTISEGFRCVNAGSSSLVSTLELAVQEGNRLLIEDVDSVIDPVLDPVLCHSTYTKVGK